MQQLFYYKMRQGFYYKMRQLLQNMTILLQNATVITKCNVFYKLRQYNCKMEHLKNVKNGFQFTKKNEIEDTFIVVFL